jgi:hypothetical protein
VPDAIAAKVKLERVANGLARPVFLVSPLGDRRQFVGLQHRGEPTN